MTNPTQNVNMAEATRRLERAKNGPEESQGQAMLNSLASIHIIMIDNPDGSCPVNLAVQGTGPAAELAQGAAQLVAQYIQKAVDAGIAPDPDGK